MRTSREGRGLQQVMLVAMCGKLFEWIRKNIQI